MTSVPMSIKKSSLKLLLPLILILGATLRLLFLFTPPMDSDQAITGLMARHILGGEFPFFFYGQDYAGSIEAYLVSIIFFFLGANRFTLDLTIVVESIFFIIFIYYLARRLFDQNTALLSALFTAFSSYYLIFHSILARAAYIEIPIIGVLLFIFSHKIIYDDEPSGRNYFFVGFLSGLGVWTHLLIVFYLPPIFLLLLIKDKWFWARKAILFFFLGLLLGGLPLWVHNTVHPLVTWHYILEGAGNKQTALMSLIDFFLYRFPEALGVMDNEHHLFFIPFFSFFMYVTYLALFLFQFVSRRKSFLALCKLKIRGSNGFDLLLLFLLLYPVIFSLSGFDAAHTSRYLQPVFACLPILLAAFTKRLKCASVVLASLFLVLHLFSNLYGTIADLPLISKSQVTQFRQARENDRDLFSFLKKKKITYVYTPDYWRSVQLTFDAREEIIFAQSEGDRYPHYTRLIDRNPQPAFLFRGDHKGFETSLINIGGTFQKSQISGYTIYYGFSPPSYRFIDLLPSKWRATADSDSKAAQFVFDRNLSTRWSPDSSQNAEQVLRVDLGEIVPHLGRITLLAGNGENAPRGLRMEISSDGRNWQILRETSGFWGALFWSGPHPFYRPEEGRIDLVFPPQAGRFLRFTQQDKDPRHSWAVTECFVYQAQPRLEQIAYDVKKLVSYLKQQDIPNIYTTPWIQSQFPPDWPAKQIGLSPQEEGEGAIHSLSNPVFVVAKDEALPLVHFLKNSLRQTYDEKDIGGLRVFSFHSPSGRYLPLSKKKWRFQTNYNPGKAPLAGDGKITTRWTTDKPQVPGTFFEIDLGKKEMVARVRLLTGNSRNDYPRGFEIRYSTDGRTWTSLNATMSPHILHWTGETLLKGSEDLDVTFPPAPMRYLKIIQTGRDAVYYWSIHEVEVYGKN